MSAKCLSVALYAALSLAAAAAPSHNLLLQAERAKTRDDMDRKKESMSLNVRHDAMNPRMTWYSQPQEVEFLYCSQTIDVAVNNLGAEFDSCDMQVVFFVEDQETRERTVQDIQKEKLNLQPGSVFRKRVISPKARYSRQTMVVDGEKKKIGSQPYGYLVILEDATGPFKWSGSTDVSRLLRTADDILSALKDKKLKSEKLK